MQDLWKGFTSQTPAAHSTYNYCPTKVREAIKVLSCSARFNVFFAGGACEFNFFGCWGGVMRVHTNLYRLMCEAVLFFFLGSISR